MEQRKNIILLQGALYSFIVELEEDLTPNLCSEIEASFDAYREKYENDDIRIAVMNVLAEEGLNFKFINPYMTYNIWQED